MYHSKKKSITMLLFIWFGCNVIFLTMPVSCHGLTYTAFFKKVRDVTDTVFLGMNRSSLFDWEYQLGRMFTVYLETEQRLNLAVSLDCTRKMRFSPKSPVTGETSPVDWEKHAVDLEDRKNWKGMLSWCQKWAKNDPDNFKAWFGLGAARNQTQMLALQQSLNELRVRDAAGRRFRVLEANGKLRDLSRMRLADTEAAGQGDWLLVTDQGRWRGVIDDQPLQQLPVQRWDTDRIGDHLRPLSSLPAIAESAPLWQAVQQLEESGSNRLLVLSPAGLPSGTIERPDLGEAVLRKLGLKLPSALLEAARRHNSYPLGLALAPVVRSMVASGEAKSS